MNNIILTTSFNKIPEANPMKAQKAGLIDVWMLFLCRYSQINAPANGHKISQTGQANIQIIIPATHHRFHRLVHQNFLVHNMGR